MVSEMVTSAAVALFALALVVLYFVEPADDALAAEVLLGDGREDEGWLPPIFVVFDGTRDPSQDFADAISRTKRVGAHGIRLYLNLSSVGAVHWDLVREGPEQMEKIYESLERHDIKLMLVVEDHGIHAAKFFSALLRWWPDMSRRLALAWWPCCFAYEDAKCTRPRNEKLGWHLVALAAEWLYQWCFEWGLLTRVSMASAVVVDAAHVSRRFVRRWSDRGLRVLVVASDGPGQQQYLRRVLQVPIVANYSSLPGRE
ncbi:hypothetical protein MTO96_048790 [Rhipicephalus appendiculatus]